MKLPHFKKSLFIKLTISLFVVATAIFYYAFNFKYYVYNTSTISLEISSGSVDTYQLFYDNGKYNYYHHHLSKILNYNGINNQVLTFKIPGSRIKKFRVDPGQKEGIVKIKQISIKHGNIVKSWKDFELERDFIKLNDINKFKVENGLLVIESKGIDPHFEFNGDLSQYIQYEKNWWVIGISLLSLIILLIGIFFYEKIKEKFVKISELMESNKKHVETNESDYRIYGNIVVSKNEIIAGIISLIIIVIAKGTVLFNLTYAIDDYSASITNQMGGVSQLLSQGRFGLVLMIKFLNTFGIHPIGSYLLTGFLTIMLTVVAGLIICRLWDVQNIWLIIVVISLFGVHPYTAEYYTFTISLYAMSLSFIIGFIAIYIVDFKLYRIFISLILLIFSISILQLFVNLYFMIIIITFILFLIQEKDTNYNLIFKGYFKTRQFLQLIILFLGVVFYYLMNILILAISDIPANERATFIDFSGLTNRIIEIKNLYFTIFFKDQSLLFPQATKFLILVLLIIVFWGLLKTFKNKIGLGIISIVCFFVAAFTILGINAPLKVWWSVPRVLIASGLFLAGIAVIAYRCYDNRLLKNIISVLLAIIIFSFVGVNNNVFTDQLRLNKRDAFRANRLFTRLEMHPQFLFVKKIVIVGGSYTYPIPTSTVIGDMNISAFCASWSKLNLLKEVTGYDFQKINQEDAIKVEAYCVDNIKSKELDRVVVIDDIGLLWLRQ